MALYYGIQYSKYAVNEPPGYAVGLMEEGTDGGELEKLIDQYIIPVGVTLEPGDMIEFIWIREGARSMNARLLSTALGAGAELDMGWGASPLPVFPPGPAAEPGSEAGIFSAVSVAAASNNSLSSLATLMSLPFYNKVFLGQCNIIVQVSAGSAPIVGDGIKTIGIEVDFVID